MKNLLAIIILFSFTFCLAGCHIDDQKPPAENNNNNLPTISKMKINIGTTIFTVTLNDSPTAAAFKAMLPLTINMEDLNSNEKFYYFQTSLPSKASTGGNIQGGDLMLYGNNCLVLFYESLHTSYTYTRLGKIDNVSGLVSALGAGNIIVKYELE